MSELPRISICIPVYNGGKFVAGAVRSALDQQDGADFEVVVCDNVSTDNTAEVLASFSDSRLTVVRATEHVDMAVNWNRVVSMARGERVLLLSADDCLLPGAIRAFSEAMTGKGKCAAVILGRPRHFDEAGDRPLGGAFRPMPVGWIENLESCAIDHAPSMNINAALFRKSEMQFKTDVGLVCDLDLYLTLGSVGAKGYALECETLAYREHADALSANRVRMWTETLAVYAKHAKGSPLESRYKRRIFRTMFWLAAFLVQHGRANEVAEIAKDYYQWLNARQRLLLRAMILMPWVISLVLYLRGQMARRNHA